MIVKSAVRLVIGIVAVVLILLVLAAAGVTLALNHLVKAGIETVGPRVMGVPVRVAAVDISLLKGSFVVTGFEVGNPKGFDSPTSFAVGRMRVDAKLRSLFSDEIVMPVVEVEAPEATLEMKDGRTNIGVLQEGLKLPERKSEKKLRIGVIRVRDASVRVAGLPGGQSMRFALPDAELTDLHTGGEAASPGEVASRTLTELYDDIMAACGELLSDEELEELRKELEDVLLSGGEGLEGTRLKLEEAAREMEKELGDLFK